MPTLSQLSSEFGTPEPILLQEALEMWLFNKIAEVDHKIAKISQRYGAASPDDIEALIRTGTIEGHPAWEDAIRLEGLLEYRGKLWKQVVDAGGPQRDS